MNRSEAELEALVNAFSIHYGDESFAIINDIVRSDPSLPIGEYSETIAAIFGSDPYVPSLPAASEPKEPELPSSPPRPTKIVPKPSHPQSQPHRHPKAPPKPVSAPSSDHNPFEILQERSSAQTKSGPLKSIWKTVLDENRATTHEDVGDKVDDNDYILEPVDIDALEDVDPVALAIAENPEFFKPVPTTSEIERSLGISNNSADTSQPSSDKHNASGASPNAPSDDLNTVSRLVANSFFLNPDDNEDDQELPLAPSVPAQPREDEKKSGAKAIDFWLPQPPATDKEARAIFDQLAKAAIEDSSGGWRGRHWSASGDFAIAPSPANILRQSADSQIKATEDDLNMKNADNGNEEFVLDEEALNFLGELFPDFEPAYLADCLRGANNSVETVAEFLLPVEMEEINRSEEEDVDSWLVPNEGDDVDSEYLRHYQGEGYHSNAADASAAPDDEEEYEDEDDLPEKDAQFNENYHKLVEIYPEVDRDWVLQALLDTNDLEKAADILMRSVVEDRPVLPEDLEGDGEPLPGAHMRPDKLALRGRRGRASNGRRRNQGRYGPAPGAWDQAMSSTNGSSDAPLNEFPVLSSDVPEYYDGRGGPIVIRPEVRAVNPKAPANARIYNYSTMTQPKGRFAAAAAAGAHLPQPRAASVESVRYVPTDIRPNSGESDSDGHWAELIAQANAMYEASTNNKRAAVQAFARHRGPGGSAASIMARLREENNNWQRLVQQSGRQFYADGMTRIDLHGLRLKPASLLVASILQAHWETGQHYRMLEIITGRGAHSVDGVARIKEDVRRQLRNYTTEWINEGCVRVLLPKPDYHA